MADEEIKTVKQLIAEKDAIEQEIKEFQDVLASQKNVGMEENLIDAEGYPRDDIDVYTVRIARNRIICLQNDHKAKMKEIEEGLHKVHAKAKENKRENETGQASTESRDVNLTPFLRVESVTPHSPAAKAGLEVGDNILKFGSLSAQNFQGLQNIASVVQHSKGIPLHVTIQREDKRKNISLTPNTWPGKGLLGCHIVPIK
ncbi:26S proteasome non-ATPase regulatory subunit 9 [Nematostella vectensis]|uniref:26S proteasome non-ATPase regulatory subunit 9 n=1 Tax=Nematostella vectensis TaxID=45351 RepID=UPI0020771998|nr:26S proteasome non-ATPase regulatory subunit 9 [Nematostella vectensis]